MPNFFRWVKDIFPTTHINVHPVINVEIWFEPISLSVGLGTGPTSQLDLVVVILLHLSTILQVDNNGKRILNSTIIQSYLLLISTNW
jgi:hypothetical protein